MIFLFLDLEFKGFGERGGPQCGQDHLRKNSMLGARNMEHITAITATFDLRLQQ